MGWEHRAFRDLMWRMSGVSGGIGMGERHLIYTVYAANV